MAGNTRTYHLSIAAGLILLSAAAAARGEDHNRPPSPPPTTLPALNEQVIYKGVVGNLLEEVPIEPEQRVQLQRGNAVLSNTFSGRSLAVFLGIASPPLMIAGLLWGLWAASQISAQPASAAAAPSSKLDVQAKRQDLLEGAGATAHRNDDEVLDRLVADLRMLIDSSEAGDRYDSLCPDGGAADCDSLADPLQQLPPTKLRGGPVDQARREAAHAQIDSGMTDLRKMPLLEVVLEQSPIR